LSFDWVFASKTSTALEWISCNFLLHPLSWCRSFHHAPTHTCRWMHSVGIFWVASGYIALTHAMGSKRWVPINKGALLSNRENERPIDMIWWTREVHWHGESNWSDSGEKLKCEKDHLSNCCLVDT
jgi:hypothetical protein